MIEPGTVIRRSLKGFWFHDGIKTVWNTRCLLHAPGRSAGDVHFWRLGDGEFRWVIDGVSWFETRAEAAAASYRAAMEPWHGRTVEQVEEMYGPSADIDRELERAWETQPAPDYDLSSPLEFKKMWENPVYLTIGKGEESEVVEVVRASPEFWKDAYRVMR